jgi:hypothetical protein
MTSQWRDQREDQIDGVSLLNLLQKRAATNRVQVIEAAQTTDLTDIQIEKGATPTRSEARDLQTVSWTWRGIVTSGGWKLLHFPPTNEYEMYNLDKDPYEEQSLAGRASYHAKELQLRRLYRQYRSCSSTGCQ